MAIRIKVSDVVYMNIVSLLGIRWFATAAQYGAASIILWILAALLYFVPISFVFAEFSSVFPDAKGGIVDWIREVYGEKVAFISSWFYLICNIFYFPTILTFSGVTLAYVISPELAKSKMFVTSYVIICFWIATYINIKGVKVIAVFGKIGGLVGNIIPIIVILVLAVILILIFKKPIPTSYEWGNWIPEFNSSNLLFLSTLTFAMSGGEITSPFVTNMANPKKDFAKATLVSALVITVCYIVGTIAFTLILNPSDIGAASGPVDVIYRASSQVGMPWFAAVISILIVLSGLIGTAIWMVGTVRMFIEGNDEKYIAKHLKKNNKRDIPANALIYQSLFVTAIVLAASFMKSVENIYIILVIMATIPLFIVYLILLLAFLKLKFKMQKNGNYIGVYSAPWKKFGALLFFIIAAFSTVVTIVIPLFSPGDNNIWIYEAETIGGPVLFFIAGWLIIRNVIKKKKSAV